MGTFQSKCIRVGALLAIPFFDFLSIEIVGKKLNAVIAKLRIVVDGLAANRTRTMTSTMKKRTTRATMKIAPLRALRPTMPKRLRSATMTRLL